VLNSGHPFKHGKFIFSGGFAKLMEFRRRISQKRSWGIELYDTTFVQEHDLETGMVLLCQNKTKQKN